MENELRRISGFLWISQKKTARIINAQHQIRIRLIFYTLKISGVLSQVLFSRFWDTLGQVGTAKLIYLSQHSNQSAQGSLYFGTVGTPFFL